MVEVHLNVTPEILQLTALCVHNSQIDSDLYQKLDVKKGLRDINGKGVLAGLTNISTVQPQTVKNGEVVLEKILESQKIIDILEDIDYDTDEIRAILRKNLSEHNYKDIEKYLNENSYLKTIWSYHE